MLFNYFIYCLDSKLRNSSIKNTKTFKPNVLYGKVVKVYDGDTITVASRMGRFGKLWRWSVRLNGIDCPEMRTKNVNEKHIAKIAQKTLEDRILGKMVTLKDVTFEKYGRLLCQVYHKDVCLNEWMIGKNLAVKYGGGTKEIVDWEKFYQDKI